MMSSVKDTHTVSHYGRRAILVEKSVDQLKTTIADVTAKNLKAVADDDPVFAKTWRVMKHAIETFGSRTIARKWLSIECGALNNQSPADFIKKTGNEAEVERILGCIDYGMIA